MSHFDIKSYLDKIYKSPVLHVRTEVIRGEDVKGSEGTVTHRDPDKQMAYIVMQAGHEFEFPNIWAKKRPPLEKGLEELRAVKRDVKQFEQKSWEKTDIPFWFRN